MKRLTAISAAAVGAVTIAACGASSSAGGGRTNARTQSTIVCDSAAAPPAGIRALRRSATSVALIRALSARTTAPQQGIATTITRVAVVRVLAGKPLPATIELRQTGAPGDTMEGVCAPLVRAGREYTAFLVPFRLKRTGPPVAGQYVAVDGGLLDGVHSPDG